MFVVVAVGVAVCVHVGVAAVDVLNSRAMRTQVYSCCKHVAVAFANEFVLLFVTVMCEMHTYLCVVAYVLRFSELAVAGVYLFDQVS